MKTKKAIKVNEKIRTAIFSKGYTQEEIASSIGISFSAFNQKLNGHREFTISEGKLIAKELDTTLDALFFDNVVAKWDKKKIG